MRRNLSALVISVAIIRFVPGTEAAAQELQRAGSALLAPPYGWVRSISGDIVSFAPPGDEGAAVLRVLPGEELREDLPSWFERRWTALLARYRALQVSPPVPWRSPHGDALIVTAALEDHGGGRSFVLFFSLAQRSRVQPIVVVSRTPDAVDRYGPLLDAVFQSVRLLPPGELPSPRVVELADAIEEPPPGGVAAFQPPGPDMPEPAGGPGVLQGLYVGLRLGPALAGTSREDYMTFFPDGTWMWRLPQEGLDGLDRARAQREFPNFWGTYRVVGDRVLLRLNTGTGEMVARRDASGRLEIPNQSALFPVARLNGLRLEGVYARERGNFPAIAFAADGTFEDMGAMGAVGLAAPDMMSLDVPPGRGTYGIANNTLTLAYADGRRLRVGMFVPDPAFETGQPPAIVLNRYSLDRVQPGGRWRRPFRPVDLLYQRAGVPRLALQPGPRGARSHRPVGGAQPRHLRGGR